MIKIDDFKILLRKDKKGNFKRYHCYCDNCGADRGYLDKSKSTLLCKRCVGKISHCSISLETRQKMSLAKKGKSPFNKGKIGVSHETSLKMRNAKLGKSPNNKGKLLSLEEKIRLSCKIQGITLEEFNGFKSHKSKTERFKFYEKQLNKKCFERDNFTCQICKVRGVFLNAHHLNSFAYFPDERFELNNLITLCRNCHKLFHKKFGNGKNIANTKEQFEEFKNNKLNLLKVQ